MRTFGLSVLAVDRVVFQGPAQACSFPGDKGRRTFEAHHEPFVAVLTAGVIEVLEEKGGRRTIAVEGGLARMTSEECVFLVTPERTLDKS